MTDITRVESWNNVLENFRKFDPTDEASLVSEEFNSYVYWYYYPETDSFAPSKYLAYKDMKMETYDGSGDVRDAVEILNQYFDKLETGSANFYRMLYKLEKWAGRNKKKISDNIVEGNGGIFIPKKEHFPEFSEPVSVDVISKDKRQEFEKLFQEFLGTYFKDKGKEHNDTYLSCRQVARDYFEQIEKDKSEGKDITDEVLLKTLPYGDTENNRNKGAWVHIAPSISGDLRNWYQNAGWTKAEDWPAIAEMLFDFISSIKNGEVSLYQKCKDTNDNPLNKGFQTGMLSPILNALTPEKYLLINNKSRKIINHFTGSQFSQKMGSYPKINAIGWALIDNLDDVLSKPYGLEIREADLFDMFCHYLITEKKLFKKDKKGYYKIAPGEKAWNWDNCMEGGYIAIGWDSLGDLSGFDRETYEEKRNELLGENPAWTVKGTDQAWTFSQIPEGSKIVANKGTTEVLGIGEVTGEYYYEPGIRHGHRMPVTWEDTRHRKVDEPGWKRTIVKLDKMKYSRIAESPIIDTDGAEPRAWVFQANPKYYDIKSAVNELDEILWSANQYYKQIKEGDTVYLWMSGQDAGILAYGKIMTDPEKMEASESDDPFVLVKGKFEGEKLRVRIRIEEVLNNPILRRELKEYGPLKDLEIIRYANATNFAVTPEEDQELTKVIGLGYVPLGEEDLNPAYTIKEHFVKETGFSSKKIEDWKKILLRKKQIVLQGPPGTGKTYVAERLAKLMVSRTNGFWDVIQFHPAYSYEDFIQGFRPKPTGDGGFEFELEKGRFLDFCKNAIRTDAPCVMIIDEINRAHLSRVFGELMYLLEYRDKEIPLASGGAKFKIPKNVYLIGTMNTADRSIALVDHALRRRFSFIRLNPDYDVLKRHIESYGYSAESLIAVLKEINGHINDHNYELGISFFMQNGEKLKNELPEIWMSEIEPYLEEYFYDQPEKVEPLRWDVLKEQKLSDWWG